MPYSYRSLAEALSDAGIDEASDEAALLLEHFAGVSRVSLMTDRDRIFHVPTLDAAVEKRKVRYPLQYILGTWEFFGLPFTVDERCLVPRPDTECLVEQAIRLIPAGGHFMDLCTGSGCIAVAVLANRPDLAAAALELYPDTLSLAAKNAEDTGVLDRFTPVCADLLKNGTEALSDFAPFDAILSNPPYIPTSVINGLSPEVHHEPLAALDGGEDGLIFYRTILRDYVKLLKSDGQIFLEIGYDQADAIRALCVEFLPDCTFRVLRDLGGNDRVVHITLPTS
ncbi:MAG: peptide chain release factor N(5)-glutamine methyltransferase [Clostridia bacterium]|nr:peptide chain release factor N(5)-glutamine methyltransferase [Clostridia bacterium]